MPTLAEQLAQITPNKKHRGRSCASCEWLESLSHDDQLAFDEAIQSGVWFIVDLYRLAAANGLVVSEDAFRRHVQKH